MFIVLSLFLAPKFFAQDSLSLKEIDSLIEQTDYDNALKALSDYIKKYPDSLDTAQKRIDKIMKARTYYAQLANKLMDVMENEPENDEKKLAIIRELETLEKNPSAEHLAFIAQAKISSEFTYYRSYFRRVMEEGAAQARSKNYVDAISTIQTGFYMYRDEFFAENPKSVTDAITRTLQDLEADKNNYAASRAAWQNAYNAFIQAIRTGNYDTALRAWGAFQTQMQRFSAIRNSVVQRGAFFENLFARMKEEKPEESVVSYLSFMSHFILGSASIPESGILGAIDAEWNYMAGGAKREIYEVMKTWLSDFVKRNPLNSQRQLSVDSSSLQTANNFAGLALDVNNLYALLRQTDGSSLGDACPLYTQSINFARTLIAQTNPSVQNYNRFQNLNAELNTIAASSASNTSGHVYTDMELVGRLVVSLGETKKTAFENLNAEWFSGYKTDFEAQEEPENKNLFALENSLLEWKGQSEFYENINNFVQEQCTLAVSAVWKDFSDYYADMAREMRSEYDTRMDIILALSSGIDENTPPKNNPQGLAHGRYPSEAVQAMRIMQRDISREMGLLLKMQEDFDIGPQEENAEQRAELEKTISTLNEYSAQCDRIIPDAQAEVRLAQSSRDRGDEYYNNALASFRREDFTGARQNIQRARELYNESLSHQESASLRESSDRNLAALGRQISDAENRIVVAEVRSLKTRAKRDYYAGNFENAENLLNRAEARWAITNVEEDEEIKNLKLLVQNALAMKTGREIKPTAPLYPEMSQILSNAHQYYDRGEKLIQQGKREEAVEILNSAKKKLQELQMVYPLNQEASLLTLRIDRLIDPEQFNASFATRIENAKENVRIPSQQQQAYSDLLDLVQIRPDYPGLRELIYNVEMDLGIRARPVDQSGLRRSAALAQEAQQLFNSAGGNEAILRQALTRLDQAISLNPENENAIMLKDRIQIAIGGKAAVVLSAADEASYNKAIQELRNNNIMGAYTIVENLLQNPANRRSTKILDLQKQIQARL